ncbi:MAG TPA: cytochrome P450 [Pseudomonadales bacterium]|nr:cytochrome P450 [Pseudomonadales bacterium]
MKAAPAIDMFGENICKNPIAFATPLRNYAPLFFDETMQLWIATGHEQCKQLFMHDNFHMSPKFSSSHASEVFAEKYPMCQKFRDDNPFTDDTRHPSIRKLLVRAFSPSALRRIEQQIHNAIDAIVKPQLTIPGVVDVAKTIADPIPYAVISAIFGVDRLLANKDDFLHHSKILARMIDPTVTTEERVTMEQSAVFMQAELRALVERARENPGEDLISDFLKAADEIGGLTDYDIMYTLMALITTGSTATAFTLTLIVHALLTQHEQRNWLQAHPEHIDNAVEELVRFAHGAKFAYRFCLRDTAFQGHTIRKGQTVLLSFAGMNNDPAVFSQPEQCQMTRNNKDALSFGHGVHYCVGAHVARTEVRFLVKAFLDYAPDARVLTENIEWNLFNFLNREISSLPVDTGHHGAA